MDTWYRYRTVWATRPLFAIPAALGVLMVVLGIVGTITQTGFALFFIPGLVVLFAHHLMINKLT